MDRIREGSNGRGDLRAGDDCELSGSPARRCANVTVHLGFADSPALPPVLESHRDQLRIDVGQTSFFLGRELPVPTTRPDLSLWREKLFVFMTRNAVSASDYFQIPPKRVVELGTQVEL